MDDGNFWQTVADKYGAAEHPGRLSSLKVALLFAGTAIASAVILTPILAVDSSPAKLALSTGAYDPITTGSISSSAGTRTYTIRRSILQPFPESVCIIQPNGSRSGEC